MSDIRLKTEKFELGGKTYELVCNMNVLADLQEMGGGNIVEVLAPGREMRLTTEGLAAMLNEANDASGDPERFTPRQIGRILPISRLNEARELVISLINAALAPDADAPKGEAGEDPEDAEKN